jgi:hypothetical protein
MVARITNNPTPAARSGSGVIRPMYGVFIRDNVAKFRNDIAATLNDTRKAIASGNAKGKEVFGDGILQGAELQKAKAAAKDLDKAVKALKTVFPNLPKTTGIPTPIMNVFPGAGGGGGIRPMYGIALRDDLAKFQGEIATNVRDIRAAINSGQLKGPDKTEAQKAIKYLDAALKDLGAAAAS